LRPRVAINISTKEKIMNKKLTVLISLLVFLAVAVSVQASMPTYELSRMEEVAGSGGSVVRETKTGLEWQRWPYGQSWTGSDRSGTPWEGNWDDEMKLPVYLA